MFGHLGVAGTTLATLLWGGTTPWQDAPSSAAADVPHGRHRGVPTRGHPKGPICGFGAGHEIQDTLDIPQPPPGGRLLLVLDAIPVLGEDGLPVDNWTRPARVVAETPSGELELIRAMTGYGAGGRFVQDITALTPALGQRCVLKVPWRDIRRCPLGH